MPATRIFPILGISVAAALSLAGWHWWRGETLVVYCAHDAIFAEGVLQDFEKKTGIKVAARFDTEATKSLGLVELLEREKDAPRCDVFWNNELLGTLDLAEQGVLLPHQGEGWRRIPPAFRDEKGRWTGFAARLRVIVARDGNADRIPAELPPVVPESTSRWAMAKPLYGTTLTHYTVLWQQWGGEKLKGWHRDWRARGGQELNGNAAVKDAVAAGLCDFGYTDTDDVFVAKDAGQKVTMRPMRLEGGQTISIPNTVSIIRGTKRVTAARRLADFLLSAETELALARSSARQVPLGPLDAASLPEEVRELQRWAADGVPLTDLSQARAECLAWLKSEYLR